jgi:hypothetical protein
MRGTPRHDAAVAAGIRSAVACPVYSKGEPIALLEWYVASPHRPGPELEQVLGQLAAALAEVYERPRYAVPGPRRETRPGVRDALRWVTEDGVLSRLLLTC